MDVIELWCIPLRTGVVLSCSVGACSLDQLRTCVRTTSVILSNLALRPLLPTLDMPTLSVKGGHVRYGAELCDGWLVPLPYHTIIPSSKKYNTHTCQPMMRSINDEIRFRFIIQIRPSIHKLS